MTIVTADTQVANSTPSTKQEVKPSVNPELEEYRMLRSQNRGGLGGDYSPIDAARIAEIEKKYPNAKNAHETYMQIRKQEEDKLKSAK